MTGSAKKRDGEDSPLSDTAKERVLLLFPEKKGGTPNKQKILKKNDAAFETKGFTLQNPKGEILFFLLPPLLDPAGPARRDKLG